MVGSPRQWFWRSIGGRNVNAKPPGMLPSIGSGEWRGSRSALGSCSGQAPDRDQRGVKQRLAAGGVRHFRGIRVAAACAGRHREAVVGHFAFKRAAPMRWQGRGKVPIADREATTAGGQRRGWASGSAGAEPLVSRRRRSVHHGLRAHPWTASSADRVPRCPGARHSQLPNPGNNNASEGESLALLFLDGAPGRIRTSDPQVRSLVLYPAELRAHEAFDAT